MMMMMTMISLRFFILRSQLNERNWAASIFVMRAFLFPCHFLKKCPGNVAGAMRVSGEMKLEEMTDWRNKNLLVRCECVWWCNNFVLSYQAPLYDFYLVANLRPHFNLQRHSTRDVTTESSCHRRSLYENVNFCDLCVCCHYHSNLSFG